MLHSESHARTYNPDTGTSVPLIQITSYEHEQSQNIGKPKVLPQLPSHKYRYTVWHELRSTQVTGDQLKAPRVREGPESKEETFHTVTDDSGDLIHHDRTGHDLKVYRDHQENWETALRVNLSFQKLDHGYQMKNFMRILHRLKSVEELTLLDNSLHDLSSLSFSKCRVANFSKNYFTSFQSLPSMPNLKHLILTFNEIKDLSGLRRFPRLESLELRGNGIYFTVMYRQSVFKALPSLKLLDNTFKTEADTHGPPPEDGEPQASTCTLM